MSDSPKKKRKTLAGLLESFFDGLSDFEENDLKDVYRLGDKKVRIPAALLPIQLNLSPSGKALHLYRETPLGERNATGQPDAIQLFDPETYYSRVSGFVRLKEGDSVTLSQSDAEQRRLLNLPDDISQRHLSITNKSGDLIFRSHTLKAGNCISALVKTEEIGALDNWRQKKLRIVRKIFGGDIKPLAPADALRLIKQVNGVLKTEAYRKPDDAGRPGGIISLPQRLTPVIVGDLHAKVDNLLVLLSQNGFIEELKAGHACMVIIGDAVHPEGKESLEEMGSSILMMDLIFKLKIRFPQQVFYLRGNHDGFSENIGKGGVAQGLLWKKALTAGRGKEYCKEMARFYRRVAYIAMSKQFIACHAGPPMSKFTLGELVNIRDHERLARELVTVRFKNSARLAGYSKKDIKRLRETLEADKKTPVVVGHTVVNVEDTIWENIGGIENHHIVYSSASDWVGAMALIGGDMQALRYRTEPITEIINSLSDD